MAKKVPFYPSSNISLSGFNRIQESLIWSELKKLNNSCEMARAIGGVTLEEKLAHLRIYQLQHGFLLRSYS